MKTMLEKYMLSYLEARRARVPRDRQSREERAGCHLLSSARGSEDGEPDLREAIVTALESGELEAAVEMGSLLETPEVARPVVRGNGCFSASGEIFTKSPEPRNSPARSKVHGA